MKHKNKPKVNTIFKYATVCSRNYLRLKVNIYLKKLKNIKDSNSTCTINVFTLVADICEINDADLSNSCSRY